MGKEIETSLVPYIKKRFELKIFIITFCLAQESFLGNGVVNFELSIALVVALIISAPKTNDGML